MFRGFPLTRRIVALCGGLSAALIGLPVDVEAAEPNAGADLSRIEASRAHGVAEGDTVWFGGVDAETGLAARGGIWDFHDCTTQSWTSVDVTDEPIFGTHVTVDSNLAHGDPVMTVITKDGSLGSLWIGAHEDYARSRCWGGGQGYGDSWGQTLSRSFTYGGSGSVTVEFDYFVDSETSFGDLGDWTYVYVTDDLGGTHGPLAEYAGAAIPYGENIGSPEHPAHDVITIDPSLLPSSPGAPFTIAFLFVSNWKDSDANDPNSFETVFGAFGVDNVQVSGTGLDDVSDFEPTGVSGDEYDGWIPGVTDPVGRFMRVAQLEELDPMEGDTAGCTLSGCVLVASDIDSTAEAPHPYLQREQLISNTIVLDGLESSSTRILHVGWYEQQAWYWAQLWRVGFHYYPWSCPGSPTSGWTIEPVFDAGWITSTGCRAWTGEVGEDLPTGADSPDSVRLVFEFLHECQDWECVPEDYPVDQAPYWDNIRFGVARDIVVVGDPAHEAKHEIRQLTCVPTPSDRPATIRFELATDARVRLTVFDVEGARTRILLGGAFRERGSYAVPWDGTDDRGITVAPGVYFVRLEAAGEARVTRTVLAR